MLEVKTTHNMLTFEKAKMYRRFNGDIDGFARSRVDDHSGISDEDWGLIDELRQALFLVRSGQAAPEFVASVEQRLFLVTTDEATREALRELAT
jgi:hypothetical protein